MNAPDIIVPSVAGTPVGGGIYAGRFYVGDRAFGLIVAPAEVGDLDKTAWGDAKKVSGALSYNDGLANTQAMASAGSALGKWAQGLRIGDFEDWYVPSRLEALIAFGEVHAAAAFARDWYWTSTQYAGAAGCARYQDFLTGYQYYGLKSAQLRCRAVRRFPIQ